MEGEGGKERDCYNIIIVTICIILMNEGYGWHRPWCKKVVNYYYSRCSAELNPNTVHPIGWWSMLYYWHWATCLRPVQTPPVHCHMLQRTVSHRQSMLSSSLCHRLVSRGCGTTSSTCMCIDNRTLTSIIDQLFNPLPQFDHRDAKCWKHPLQMTHLHCIKYDKHIEK